MFSNPNFNKSWLIYGGIALLLWWALVGRKQKPDAPSPAKPDDAARPVKLLVVSAPGCAPCARLKQEWPTTPLPYPVEWVDNSQALADRWRIQGTPTLILLGPGEKEIKRQLGYLSPPELLKWLTEK
jgi:thiol-disulfide isomerase/thioredoxin